jgi:hypothetical protein
MWGNRAKLTLILKDLTEHVDRGNGPSARRNVPQPHPGCNMRSHALACRRQEIEAIADREGREVADKREALLSPPGRKLVAV